MISGYNAGGQPVKVLIIFNLSLCRYDNNFLPETLGARQEIDQYARLRLYISLAQVRYPVLYRDDCQSCVWGD